MWRTSRRFTVIPTTVYPTVPTGHSEGEIHRDTVISAATYPMTALTFRIEPTSPDERSRPTGVNRRAESAGFAMKDLNA
jgi:hypothetical protein